MATLIDTRTVNPNRVEAQLRRGKRLAPIFVPIRLRRDEHCLFADECEWSAEPRRSDTTAPPPTDIGFLYITSQRVLFKGQRRSKSASASDIDHAEDWKNGVVVHRANGKSDFFAMGRYSARLVVLLIDALTKDGFERADVVAFVIKEFEGPRGPENDHDDVL